MIIAGDDLIEIRRLNNHLAHEFDIKNWVSKNFLGIETTYSKI